MATTQDVSVTNWPDSSPARVAMEMYFHLRTFLPKKEGLDAAEQALTLFAACRDAAAGRNWGDDFKRLR